MVYILANDNRIKTQDPYELVRAFYGDGDIEIIDMDKRDPTTLNSETVSISIEGDVYKVSLLRGNTLIDSEQMSYHQKDFYRGETASRNNTVKHLIYKILSRKLDTELPWGILTGIRPVKVSKMLMDKGLAQEDAIDILVDSYLLREDKARLITDVSLNQNPILDALKKNSYSIYVGIPFCPTRCFYCSFPTLITHKNKDIMEEYVNSLIEELEDTCSMMGSWDLNTVYIGGGTT
jgi:oxygen-independent coproporphyrinogen-3 oxidase